MGREGENELVHLDVLLDGPTIDEINQKSEIRNEIKKFPPSLL